MIKNIKNSQNYMQFKKQLRNNRLAYSFNIISMVCAYACLIMALVVLIMAMVTNTCNYYALNGFFAILILWLDFRNMKKIDSNLLNLYNKANQTEEASQNQSNIL